MSGDSRSSSGASAKVGGDEGVGAGGEKEKAEVKIKIKSLPGIEYIPSLATGSDNPIEQAALYAVHAGAVKKAWTPIVTAMLMTGEPVDDLPALIAAWAEGFRLGERSKKRESLAHKKAKAYVEETLREARYSIAQARSEGLIERSTAEIFARGEAERFYEEAEAELAPAEFLDPLPITAGELAVLRASEKS